MYKKILALIMSCTLCIGLMSCSGSSETADTSDQVTISFSWWGTEARYEKTMEAIELFEEKYPNIKVKTEFGEWTGFKKRMSIDIAGNNESDLMQINYDWLETYSKDGTGFYDLSQLEDTIDLNNFSDDILNYGTKNGVLNAIPIAMNAKVLYYNTSISSYFKEGKINTWDELIQAGSKVGEQSVIAEDAFDSWILCMAYEEEKTGKSFIDGEGNLGYTQDDIKDLLTFYKSLVDNKVVSTDALGDSDSNTFNSNKGAMTLAWVTDASKIEKSMESLNNNVEVNGLPSIQGNSGISYVKPAMLYAISKNTDHPKEAALLMNFMLNDEEAGEILGIDRGIPTSTATYSKLEEDGVLTGLQYVASQKLDGTRDVLMSSYYENTLIKNICQEAINEVAFGKATPEACAATTYNDLVKTLDSLK